MPLQALCRQTTWQTKERKKERKKNNELHCLQHLPANSNEASSASPDADPVDAARPAPRNPTLALLREVKHKDEFIEINSYKNRKQTSLI